MRERPILFSSPMVRAILDGRKVQTRRMVKIGAVPTFAIIRAGRGGWAAHCSPQESSEAFAARATITRGFNCPYEADRLWVRETWDAVSWTSERYPERLLVCYGADGEQREFDVAPEKWPSMARGDNWRPSIHMPRWASRILLTVESVRVERLHDIGEEDARAEGAGYYVNGHGFVTDAEINCDGGYHGCGSYRLGFEMLWSEINGAESWDANPWVWVVGFRRLSDAAGTTEPQSTTKE